MQAVYVLMLFSEVILRHTQSLSTLDPHRGQGARVILYQNWSIGEVDSLWLEPNNNIKRLYPPQKCPQMGTNGNTNRVVHKDKSRRLRKAMFLSGLCLLQTQSI